MAATGVTRLRRKLRPHIDQAAPHPLEVAGQPADAVGVDAAQVGADQAMGDDRGVVLGHVMCCEERAHKPIGSVGRHIDALGAGNLGRMHQLIPRIAFDLLRAGLYHRGSKVQESTRP